MGRPPLNMQLTSVRLPKETLDRIDALVSNKRRAMFIRDAVEHALKTEELIRQTDEAGADPKASPPSSG
jgi:predicted DNA-binding protein